LLLCSFRKKNVNEEENWNESPRFLLHSSEFSVVQSFSIWIIKSLFE
jgi:hypothetical protein